MLLLYVIVSSAVSVSSIDLYCKRASWALCESSPLKKVGPAGLSKWWQEVPVCLHYSFNLYKCFSSSDYFFLSEFGLLLSWIPLWTVFTLFTRVWIQSASFLLKSDSLSSNLLVTYSEAAWRHSLVSVPAWTLIGPRSCPSNISCVLIGVDRWKVDLNLLWLFRMVLIESKPAFPNQQRLTLWPVWPLTFSFLFSSFFRFRTVFPFISHHSWAW